MSAIPFQNIPDNLRLPLFFAEVDNSQANSNQQNQRALLIGQMSSAGSATPNVPVISTSKADAITKFGAGSQLAMMAAAYRGSDSFGEVWFLPLADPTGSTPAMGDITIGGAPTAPGTLSIYICGQLVAVTVALTDTPTTIAESIVSAVAAANPVLPVTATSAAGAVTLTAVNKGALGEDMDVRLNYYGSAGGEETPPGITVTLTPFASGAGVPTLSTALANLGDEPYDFIVSPFTDTTSMDAVKQLLNDQTGRWSWQSQVYGHSFTAYRGTVGALTTYGTARNNQHETVLGFNDSPSPNWVWAADYAGAAAVALRADPGRPLQTVQLHTVLPPPVASRFSMGERNTLLWDGISTFAVGQDGTVSLENVITTYQENAYGQPDDSYLEVETMFLLTYVLRDLAATITSKFPRMKLADDGTRFAPGSAIVTPSIIKAELIAEYQNLEYNGYVQDADVFAQSLIVQRNATNPNRVDVLWPGTLINQLRVFALLAQFRL